MPKRPKDIRRNPRVLGLQALARLLPRFVPAITALEEHLRKKSIRYAVCGGAACVMHGGERSTPDIDVLVGDEAFPANGIIVEMVVPIEVGGVTIDTVPLPVDNPEMARILEDALSQPDVLDGIPVVPLLHLVCMKLNVGRRKDLVAVEELILNQQNPRRVVEELLDFFEAREVPESVTRNFAQLTELEALTTP